MTADELRGAVTRAIIDTRFGEEVNQKSPDYRIVADAAIRVVIEAAMQKCTNHAEFIREVQSDFESKGYNTAPKVAKQIAHEWDCAALQISTLIPESAK